MGIVIVVSVLVNPEFTVKSGRIGISLGGKVRTSPLAIGQMGGTLAIIGGLYIPRFASNKVSLALRIGAFVMGFLLALYSGSRGQVLFAGIVIAVCLPLSKKIRDARTFISTLTLLGLLGITAYLVFDLVVSGMDFNRWDSKYVDGATAVRAASVGSLLIVFATTPSAWLIGLGFNAFSSVCSELSMPYSHSTFADILAELGLPAFIVLIAMLVRTYRAGKALMIRYGDSPSDRSSIATLLALVIYQVLLVNKEGNLWSSVNLFMFMIVIDRLECRCAEFGEVEINPKALDTADPQELTSNN
jgi:O-antigen ligase